MLTQKIKTYLLIHGAWHGGWCWSKLIPYLQKKGHRVIVAFLPGHDDNPCNFKDITLHSYIKYVENLIELSPAPVVLVGHSMAGVILTQVAETKSEKIEQLIYIAAFVPEPGQSIVDEEQKALVPRLSLEVKIDSSNHSLVLPIYDPNCIRELLYKSCDEEDFRFALSRLRPQPLKPFLDSVSFSYEKLNLVPKLYLECLQDKAIDLQDQRRMHQKIKCQVKSLNTDHSPFLSNPQDLADLLC